MNANYTQGSGDFQRTLRLKGILLRGRGSYGSWTFLDLLAPEGLEGSGHDLRSHAHRFIHPDITRDQGTALDGQNLSTLWQDSAVPGDLGREALFFHYPHYYPTTTPVSAMRHGPWKYLIISRMNARSCIIFPDEGENHNLMATHPEVVQRMRSQLRSWWEEVDAPMPEKRPERP